MIYILHRSCISETYISDKNFVCVHTTLNNIVLRLQCILCSNNVQYFHETSMYMNTEHDDSSQSGLFRFSLVFTLITSSLVPFYAGFNISGTDWPKSFNHVFIKCTCSRMVTKIQKRT